MSLPEDLETLRGVYDEWARGEFWNADVYDPEIVFVLGDSLPDPGTYNGIEGLDKGFRGWLETWRELRFELEELIPAGDRIVVVFRQSGIGRTSGIQTEMESGHVWTMRNGKAVRLEVHMSRAEALEVAGLTE
jgi:uncharacterized protein